MSASLNLWHDSNLLQFSYGGMSVAEASLALLFLD